MSLYFLEKIYEKFFSKDYYYLISMSMYHVLIILFTLILHYDLNTKTFMLFQYETTGIKAVEYSVSYSFESLFLISVILMLDFAFLKIVSSEFESLKLSTIKIIIIEVCLMILSYNNPMMRNVLYFMSLNTFQIYIGYKIIKYIPFAKIIVIFGSYVLIIRLIYDVIFFNS